MEDMKKEIDFAKIERKWQKKWADEKVFEVSENSKKKKYYVLEMFPYPSASGLHMGHAFNYTVGDIFARFKRMQGFNVLHPMGFDSFGLPAENAAIKAKSHPKKFTEEAISNYVRQMKELGISYSWDRMVVTHRPDYYKWDQWIFLEMFKKGLAYKKRAPVNWCSKCNTVLANEQVQNGKCWRHEDTNVEIKHLEQWFLRTTKYADELYSGLDKLDDWPELIKTMQRNWIGKSKGSEILFEINGEKWPVFTTRADTLMGVTFMVVSAQHPGLTGLVAEKQKKDVEKFLKRLKSVKQEDMDKMDKEGVFTGSYAIHPVTGEKIPVWAGNFVVADYGSGMVMAVPAHDERDYEFAKKYGIKIKQVIKPKDKNAGKDLKEAFIDSGVLINSDAFNGLESDEAKVHITKWLEGKKIGRFVTNYKLRDWLISRQRFWGTPIPVVYCDKCGIVAVNEKDLPVLLPDDVKFEGIENPLARHKNFLEAKCPKCNGKARRETDTMDTFVNSSWYYLRYADSKNAREIFERKKADYWVPIDLYIGGKEHACLHLIYIRFYTKFLRDLGLIGIDEPALRLFNQGMLAGPDGEKMSKSKGNVVLPDAVSDKYGMDSARLFLVSIASPDKDINWSDEGVEGSLRFIKRVFDYVKNVKISKSSRKTEHKVNSTIKKVTEEIEYMKYNLAVIKVRNMFESLEDEISRKDLESALKLLAPFCPHIAEELWEKINGKGFVSLAEWPKHDEKKIDLKLEEAEKNAEKTIDDVLNILKIIKEKQGRGAEKVYIYAIPNEIENYDSGAIGKRIGLPVAVYAVNDKKKHDPEGKAGKAKPGRPGIYAE